VSRAVTARFLVLDDLGWESRRSNADDVVCEVIAARYDAGRITYATTGLRIGQLEERYSSAVVRRLLESGGLKGKVIDCWPKEVQQ
jgi:DNA replication protein DnaC